MTAKRYVNNSARLISIGGVQFTPTQPVEVPEEVLNHPGWQDLIKSKEIEEYNEEQQADPAKQEQPQVKQQTATTAQAPVKEQKA